MPLITRSSYPGPPRYQFNGHLQTIVPALRRAPLVLFERERLETDDEDFLDLDWLDRKSRRLVILSHGLEGNSRRPYILGTAAWFGERGWDVLAWNCRSCSGEMNRAARLYHHGEITDLDRVIRHALSRRDYERIVLVGFSMGGAMVLKYLGVHGRELPGPIDRGVAFSSPCVLEASVEALEYRGNGFYKRRFQQALTAKLAVKAEHHPGLLDLSKLAEVRSWRDFDEYFSAPLNGFASASDLYAEASAANFMAGIRVPALLVNADNDPIIPEACTPVTLCEKHPHIHLERPRTGGHVGFMLRGKAYSWMEERAWAFCEA